MIEVLAVTRSLLASDAHVSSFSAARLIPSARCGAYTPFENALLAARMLGYAQPLVIRVPLSSPSGKISK